MRKNKECYHILEAVMLQVKTGLEDNYENAYLQASKIISSIPGYITHELQRCMEVQGKYLLLVRWETLENHTVGLRESLEYQEWKKLLHPYYDPFPVVEHFEKVQIP